MPTRTWALLAAPLLLWGAEPRLAPGLEAIRAADLRADLIFLASDALQGRRSMERGSDVAAQFIAAEFSKAGLKPAGSSFLQPVPLIEYRIDRNATRVVLHRGGAAKTYAYGADFSGGFPHDATLRAPVVFAGYGITAPEFGYDDYAEADVRGKIVLIFDHEPQENDPRSVFNGLGNTRHASMTVKTLNAQKHGAVALLVMSEPNRKHPSAQERMARVPGGAQRQRRLAPQALAESEIRIPQLSVSDALAAELLAPAGRKASELQSSIDTSLKPAPAAFADTAIEMRIRIAEMRRGESSNVIGMLEGSDATLRDETIVFSAHHDHDGAWDGEIRPGADDNGSGTAGVLELARAFARNPARPKRTLLFAIFAAEERGLLGSYYYAAHPLRPLASTRAAINFDMIGRNEAPSRQTDGLVEISPDTSNELGLIGTINSPAYRAVVERENREIGLKLNYKWDQDAALGIFARSDQFPFALHRIPAVWWFTGFHPDYHQATDTVEKINFEKMVKILRLAYLTGWSFANEDTPAFVEKPNAH